MDYVMNHVMNYICGAIPIIPFCAYLNPSYCQLIPKKIPFGCVFYIVFHKYCFYVYNFVQLMENSIFHLENQCICYYLFVSSQYIRNDLKAINMLYIRNIIICPFFIQMCMLSHQEIFFDHYIFGLYIESMHLSIL